MKKIFIICFFTSFIQAGDIEAIVKSINKKWTTELKQEEQDFSQAINETPGYTFAYSNLAKVLLDLRKPHKAVWRAEKALELDALNFDARLFLGIAYCRTEQREAALNTLQQVVKHDHLTTEHLHINHRTLACHQVAMTYSDLHELDNAILYYSKAMALDGTFLSPAFNLAFIHYNRGEYQKAKNIFVKYITKNPHAAHGPFAYALMIQQLKSEKQKHLQDMEPNKRELQEELDQETYNENMQLTAHRLQSMPTSMPNREVEKQLRFMFTAPEHISPQVCQAIKALLHHRMPELLPDDKAEEEESEEEVESHMVGPE